jgi:hypothetical protein
MKIIDLNRPGTKLNIGHDHNTYVSMFDSYKPDPEWNCQDEKGHIHRWDLALKTVTTLRTVVDETIPHYRDGDYWEDVISHQECIICGEHIKPGYLIDVPACEVRTIPTLKRISGSYVLNPGEELPDGKQSFEYQDQAFDAYIIGQCIVDEKIVIEFAI